MSPASPETPAGRPPAPPPPAETPVIAPGHTFATITDKISAIVLTRKTPVGWFVGFAIAFSFLMLFMLAVSWLLVKGVGIWGINVPVAWGFAIINFVWWIGIGHAGTLISAILLLLHQQWRTSINRFAEAMTLFAVACAGMFPILHMGRPWLAYWLFPYPNSMSVWPQFRSPLVWDVFAVSTYGTVSLLFWFIGLVPDMATLRDRARSTTGRVVYGVLSLGWRGSARHWARYESAYLLLAGLATPLVISVHTVVSFDFAIAIVPGWHTTIFPPYFVAGAIYSGFAMVLTLAIPIRAAYGLQDFITARHLENMAKVMLATGLIVAYGYSMEAFVAWYSGNPYERFMYLEPGDRPVLAGVLGAHRDQHRDAAAAVAEEGAAQGAPAVRDCDRDQRRHVARTLRDRRHQPAPRLPAIVVGDVLPDDVGLVHVPGDARIVRDAAVPVPALPAGDLDLRDADAAAGGQGQGRNAHVARGFSPVPAGRRAEAPRLQ